MRCGKGFGGRPRSVRVAYAPHIPKRLPAAMTISAAVWDAGPWPCIIETGPPETVNSSGSSVVDKLTSEARDDLGFVELGSVAKIRIGTVTGANSFFTMSDDDAAEHGIPASYLRPLLRSSRELPLLRTESKDVVNGRMLVIPAGESLPRRVSNYIQAGRRRGLHGRHHTKKREKWYCIPDPVPPAAFMQYMVSDTPFLRANPDGILSTNNIHQITFDADVNEMERAWIELSSYSSIFQWSAEVHGRTYGGGVLKLEPGKARKLLVYSGAGQSLPDHALSNILDLIEKGDKASAVAAADAVIQMAAGASSEAISAFSECHRALRDRRIGL